MKLTCFIASTLLFVFIGQHSTNGLPIDDVTTQRTCLKGFELVDGKCQPILSSSPKTDIESSVSELDKVTLSNEVTTKETEKHDTVFEDQLATTFESKKLDDKPVEHKEEPLDHTEEPVDHTEESVDHTDEPVDHTEEPLDHTEETVDHTDEPVNHTEETVDYTSEPEDRENETLDHTSEPKEDERKPKEDEEKPKEDEDKPKEDEDKPEKEKLEDNEDKPKEDEPTEDETEPSAKNDEKSDNIDIPKGCPPGTKADEQGACQDEVEYTSTKPTMNLKDLLSKDGSCPTGMKLYKKKCVYIKSEQPLEEKIWSDSEDDKIKKNDYESKLVSVLNGGLCPAGTEYHANGLCRVRTTPLTTKILTSIEKCQVDEILIDGKCKRKETEPLKKKSMAPRPKPSDEDEE